MLILKGFIIGLGKIIPGVSGSMLAISMGIYEKLLYSINNFFKDIVNNSKLLIKVMIGVLISIALFSNIMTFFLKKYYTITIFSFIGLIWGSIDKIKCKTNIKKNYKLFCLIFIILIVVNTITYSKNVSIDNFYLNIVYWLCAGFIEAISTIFPGISGTSMLMMIGAYNKLLFVLSNVFNVDNFIYNFAIILPFVVGMIIGIFALAKLVTYLLSKYEEKTYCAIYAFSYTSIVVMMINCFRISWSFSNILISIIFMLFFFWVSKKVNHLFYD